PCVAVPSPPYFFLFLSTARAPPALPTLSLHDALPICARRGLRPSRRAARGPGSRARREVATGARCGGGGPNHAARDPGPRAARRDRKSTRLNSSHVSISYAVFCLKKKIKTVDLKQHMQ